MDNLVWQRPSTGMLKCNIDGAIFQNSNSVSVGMMLWDDTSSFVIVRSTYFNGLGSIREVKIIDLVEAIHWVLSIGFPQVLFELDANSVVDGITSTVQNISKFGYLIHHCRILFCEISGFKICYITRQAYVVTHTIARASHFYASLTVFTYPPVITFF